MQSASPGVQVGQEGGPLFSKTASGLYTDQSEALLKPQHSNCIIIINIHHNTQGIWLGALTRSWKAFTAALAPALKSEASSSTRYSVIAVMEFVSTRSSCVRERVTRTGFFFQ